MGASGPFASIFFSVYLIVAPALAGCDIVVIISISLPVYGECFLCRKE